MQKNQRSPATYLNLDRYAEAQVPTSADSEKPAPRVAVSEGGEGHHGGTAADSEPSESDGASKGLGIAALVLGALGLATGGAALLRSRRSA